MGEVRERVKWIGGEAFAVVSGPEQEPVYIDPSMVIAVLGPEEDYRFEGKMYHTCRIYMTGGINFASNLGVEDISRAMEEARHANYPPNTGVR